MSLVIITFYLIQEYKLLYATGTLVDGEMVMPPYAVVHKTIAGTI
jgi:hypothetical protein